MFEVLKGKYSSPKYKETYKAESLKNAGFNAIDNNEQSWNLGKNGHSLYGESKLERRIDDSRPIVIAVEHKSENRRKYIKWYNFIKLVLLSQ